MDKANNHNELMQKICYAGLSSTECSGSYKYNQKRIAQCMNRKKRSEGK